MHETTIVHTKRHAAFGDALYAAQLAVRNLQVIGWCGELDAVAHGEAARLLAGKHQGGSLVRESHPRGSVRGCSAMGIPTAIRFADPAASATSELPDNLKGSDEASVSRCLFSGL